MGQPKRKRERRKKYLFPIDEIENINNLQGASS